MFCYIYIFTHQSDEIKTYKVRYSIPKMSYNSQISKYNTLLMVDAKIFMAL